MHTPDEGSFRLYSARQSPNHHMALHSAIAAAQSVRSSAPPSRRGASSDTSSSSESSGILAHRIMFRPPKVGRTKLVQVTSDSPRGTWSIPALSYLAVDGQVLIYPFTRMQLGKVMIVGVDVQPEEIQNIRTPALFEYCAKRSDLPKEMVEKLAFDMEMNGGGPHLDRTRLADWRLRLYDPHGDVRAGVPCPHCHRVNQVRMAEIAGLHNISSGLFCDQLGKQCAREDAPAIPRDNPRSRRLVKEERSCETGGIPCTPAGRSGMNNVLCEGDPERNNTISNNLRGTPTKSVHQPPTNGGIWRGLFRKRPRPGWCLC